ncbi:transporter [Aidingimonas lacisalsi]|uniref:transporter n=1 Tax=Aidingimonas lacisalsi TaxID=2604086 RepID=UPI001F3B17F2|nr:transporter [Aidingimonas lacisalsi]
MSCIIQHSTRGLRGDNDMNSKILTSMTGLSLLLLASQVLAQDANNRNSAEQQPVGQAPEIQQEQPEIQAIPDIGGVLTPKGRLVIEPEIQYSHASVNRLTFRGIEILSTFLIGVFEAEDADRDTMTASVTGRLGVTDRLELELKVPYVYRDDTLYATVPDAQGFSTDRSLTGNGLGDIEIAAHYQMNRGQDGWPYFIGNLRYKSTTGEGPFDIRRDADGIERELATGSGFHSIEPSLTLLFPSDPAVYFANFGYLYNMKDDIDEPVGDLFVGEVDPGDAVRVSFGMAYSINERSSFTLGYKNDFINKTKTRFTDDDGNSVSTQSSTLNVGSLLLGWSYQLSQDTSVNLGLELGVTDDAPDTMLTLRIPFGMNVF